MGEKERGLLYPIRVDGTESLPFMIKKDRVIFGRADHCDIRIYIDEVAPKHCLIAFNNDGKGFIVPLHKRGMTYINGALLRKRECLTHNDVITIGKRSFRFHNSAEVNSDLQPSTPQCDEEVSDIFSFHTDGKKKRKLERRVTFGPRLSPEEFDKTMPPATPLRRGSLPNKDDKFSSSAVKYKTRRNSATGPPEIEKLTPSKRTRNEKAEQKNKRMRLSSPRRSSVERVEEDSDTLDNDVSTLEIVPKSQLAAARSISSCLPPFPVSSDESVWNMYVETVQKLALSVSMMSAYNMYNKILNDVSSITSGLPGTSKDTRSAHFLQSKEQLSMSNFQNFVQTVFTTPFTNNNQSNMLPSCENLNSRSAKHGTSTWTGESSQNTSKSSGRSSFNKSYMSSNKTATVSNISELNQNILNGASYELSSQGSSIQDTAEDEYSDDDVFQDDSNDNFENDPRKSFSGFSMKQNYVHSSRKSLPAKYVKRKTSSRKSGRLSSKIISVHSNYKYLQSKRVSNVNKKQKRISIFMKKYINMEPKDIKMSVVEDKDDSDFIDIDDEVEIVDVNPAPLQRKSSMNFKRVTRAASSAKNGKSAESNNTKRSVLPKQQVKKIASKSTKSSTIKSKVQKETEKVVKARRGRKPRIATVDDNSKNKSVTLPTTADEKEMKSKRSGLKTKADKPAVKEKGAKRGRKPLKKNAEIDLPEIAQSSNSNVEEKKVKRGRRPQNKVLKSPVKNSPIAKAVNDSQVDSSSVLPEKAKRGRKPRKIADSIPAKDVPKIKRGRKSPKIPNSDKHIVLIDLETPLSAVKKSKRGPKPANLSKIFDDLDMPKEKKTRKRRDSNIAVEVKTVKRGRKTGKSDASKSEVVKEKNVRKGRKKQNIEEGSTVKILPNQPSSEEKQKPVRRGRPKTKVLNMTPEQKIVKRSRKPRGSNLNVSNSKDKIAVTNSPKKKSRSHNRELKASPQKNTPSKVTRRKRII